MRHAVQVHNHSARVRRVFRRSGPIADLLPLEPLGDAAWPVFFFFLSIVFPILVMSFIGGGFRQIIDDLGLTKNPIWAKLVGLAATAPAFIGFALQAPFDAERTTGDFLRLGLFYPSTEEVFFRGFLFGQLYRRGDSALGGLFANVLRAVVIVLALLFCFLAPRYGWLTLLQRGGGDRRAAST